MVGDMGFEPLTQSATKAARVGQLTFFAIPMFGKQLE